jgi:hypothetical protein
MDKVLNRRDSESVKLFIYSVNGTFLCATKIEET